MRFFRHKLAVTSLIILVGFGLVALFAGRVAPYTEDWSPLDDANYLNSLNQAPSLDFPFGTDQLGRDYLSRVIYGVQTSLGVAIVVALLATFIGTVIGAVAGYYGGAIDNGLDALHGPHPHGAGPRRAARRRCVPRLLGGRGAARPHVVQHPATDGDRPHPRLPVLDRDRAHRARPVPLVTREGVRGGGQGRRRPATGASSLRHILPNCVGPIVVNTTLIIAAAILVEAALSFLGFGIQPPDSSIGKLIADGQQQGPDQWWLILFPGLVITAIALCVNFVGDGLRDALDPTQRVRA